MRNSNRCPSSSYSSKCSFQAKRLFSTLSDRVSDVSSPWILLLRLLQRVCRRRKKVPAQSGRSTKVMGILIWSKHSNGLDYFLMRSYEEGVTHARPEVVEDLVQDDYGEYSYFWEQLEGRYVIVSNAHGFAELLINLLEYLIEKKTLQERRSSVEEADLAKRKTKIPKVDFYDVLALWGTLTPSIVRLSTKMIHLKVKVPLSIQRSHIRSDSKIDFVIHQSPPPKMSQKTHNSKYINILSKAYDDDSESTLQESFLLHSSKISYIPQNPLDFDYFDMVLRSSDESLYV
ncbi:unnamed protein product [Lepeophtheirus salmonis]|uniref:(salmon louse) hypothetical protein n=1 Tax=Lepeophtheirus salmonis TaxID=72036 RepID=A0A7R8CFI9_LEPSM|nr:unnamed protein product [Lepeophtheirus salmonis]CAF2807165.1 unnamed protein product [Lepeophtheirus salmonis]